MVLGVQPALQMPKPPQPEGDDLEGRYSNIFRIGYNAYEFILDFGQCHPPGEEHMHTRIVTNPSSAKDLSELLHGSVDEHEKRYEAGGRKE